MSQLLVAPVTKLTPVTIFRGERQNCDDQGRLSRENHNLWRAGGPFLAFFLGLTGSGREDSGVAVPSVLWKREGGRSETNHKGKQVRTSQIVREEGVVQAEAVPLQ